MLDEGLWRSTYVAGVTLGPARPGEFAVTASLDYRTYRDWLHEIVAANANTLRVYTILPPAFYRAFADHNEQAEEPLWLIQGVWLDDLAENLYEPRTKEAFESEIRDVIDIVHGQADIACVAGHYCGVYAADISRWVIGVAIGRDVAPFVIRRTNRQNPARTSYLGDYVSFPDGTPSEAWFAEMCDLAVRYEMDTYNAQRPISVVNWPALDPMSHPTEATLEEELNIRRLLGEEVTDTLPEDPNDLDVVSIDVSNFEIEPGFEAGMFVLYHVFHHWPEFLFRDPAYLAVRDESGANPFLGYLQDLKSRYPDTPVLIGGYGISTSLDPTHLHPLGWHNGGITEQQQAQLLVRFSQSIRQANMAGGIVFEWLDEWWKQVNDDFTAPLEGTRDFDPLWLNRSDPEEAFGLVGYRSFGRVRTSSISIPEAVRRTPRRRIRTARLSTACVRYTPPPTSSTSTCDWT